MNHLSNPIKMDPPNVLPEGSDVYRDNISAPSVSPLSLVPPTLPSLKPAISGKRKSYKKTGNLPFNEFWPWEEPVDLAQLLDEISDTILKFVVLDKVQADTSALWIAHTYLVDVFDTSPIAIIDAPERACAKTLFQTVLSSMSYQSLSASNATASSLFRSVELWNPTIFFDEADTFFKDNQDLHGMVNAGYKKGGFVLRTETVGDDFIPRKFSVYSAKSIAGIALEKHLPDSTMSRGIVFGMRRKLPHERVVRLRYAGDWLFEVLAAKLTRFAKDYEKAVSSARPVLPEELSDRAQDNWEPLLAIASCASEDWLARATAAALKLSSASNESVSTGNELLADIQHVFEKRLGGPYADKISSSVLIDSLIKIEDAPWSCYNHGHPLSPRQLAKNLSYYGIKPKTVRISKYETPKGYDLEQFRDAFARYLLPIQPDIVAPTDDEDVVPSNEAASTASLPSNLESAF